MHKYTWTLSGYDVLNPRSRDQDTNYISAKLLVNDQPIGAPQTKSMGNQGKGAYGAVGFTWADVDVPDELPATTVKLCYQIMNLGNLKPADAQQAMTEIMAREEHESDEPDSWVVVILKWLTVKGIQALLAYCDGPIGPREGRIVVWHSFELLAAPQGVASEETVHEHGNNSPTGCGSNSRYDVHFSTLRH
jgi:hypothetical protein